MQYIYIYIRSLTTQKFDVEARFEAIERASNQLIRDDDDSTDNQLRDINFDSTQYAACSHLNFHEAKTARTSLSTLLVYLPNAGIMVDASRRAGEKGRKSEKSSSDEQKKSKPSLERDTTPFALLNIICRLTQSMLFRSNGR